MIEQLQKILEKYSEYLGWDEETATSMYGIALARIPAVAAEIASILEGDYKIAKNMEDYWKHMADGAANVN